VLEIGNGDFDAGHLTGARAHLSLWAMINAPLLLGSDVTKWPVTKIGPCYICEVRLRHRHKAARSVTDGKLAFVWRHLAND